MKKIVYMGTPEYAKVILEKIIEMDGFEVSLVVTQPDKPTGRKQELMPPAVKILATHNGIDVIQPKTLKDSVVYEIIKDIKPDFIVVAAFGQMLPKIILDIAPCINLHASLLPLYRGASPIQQALLNSDNFTGITAMLMEEGLDSGPVLGYRYFRIPQQMKLDELFVQMSKDAALLAVDILQKYDTILPLSQTKSLSSHCKKIEKSNGLVDLSDAQKLLSAYRAYFGWPGIFLNNKLKLLDIDLVENHSSNKEGMILSLNKESMVVGCKRGSIQINILQPESKKPMSAKAYLLGRGLGVGDSIL